MTHPRRALSLSPRLATPVALLGFAVALLGCYLPWVEHPAAALAPHVLDLAEWTSLHPAVRASAPPLLLTFALRLPLAMIGVGVAFAARWGWLPGLVIALTLLPPFSFFRDAFGDPNYRQGFALALMTGALVLLSLLARRLPLWVGLASSAAPALVGSAATLLALPEAMRLINAMYSAGVGAGGPLALAGFVLAASSAVAVALIHRRRLLHSEGGPPPA